LRADCTAWRCAPVAESNLLSEQQITKSAIFFFETCVSELYNCTQV
jgi:hypothetical protein